MKKTCSKCGETKPLNEFHNSSRAPDGHRYNCKECQRTRDKAWYKANKERAAATNRTWRKTNPEREAATSKAWYEANKDRRAATSRAWREANPDRVAAISKAWNEANSERVIDGRLRRTYDISSFEYDDMLEAQGGGCAICGKTPEAEGRRLSVDHDHETGRVRGLLCNLCNRGLGHFTHDLGLLYSAISYLEQRIEQEDADAMA